MSLSKIFEAWGIALVEYERGSLLRFLGLYLGSTLLLLGIIIALFYQDSQKSLLESAYLRLEVEAGEIAKEIVLAHMHGQTLTALHHPIDAHLTLYDIEGRRIAGLEAPFDLTIRRGEIEGLLYVVNDSAFGHLGIDHIVLSMEKNLQSLESLKGYLLLGFALLALLLGLFSYLLSRLFLRPIKEEIKRIDSFIKNATHELNTPLTALLATAKSLQKGEVDEKKISRLLLIAKQIEHLYSDLSYLFFKDIRHQEDRFFDLGELARSRALYFEELANNRALFIQTTLHSLEIKMDEVLAERIIDNLLSNAIKYAYAGTSIELIVQKEGWLYVQNEGVEIPQEEGERIFERYYRFHPSSKGASGLGIGLSIIKEITLSYHLPLFLSSKEGKTRLGVDFSPLIS